MTDASRESLKSAMAAMTGLQQLQAMMDGHVPPPSIARTLDYRIASIAEGEAVFEGAPHKGVLNPMGAVHGGWYGVMLDSAMGCAVHTMMKPGQGYTTLEYKINLIRGAKPGDTPLKAVGKVSHLGRRTAVATGRILDETGRCYAEGSTTCLVFDL